MLKSAIFPMLLAAAALAGCSRNSAPEPTPAPATAKTPSPPASIAATASPADAAMRLPAPARLVAIGDVHGDLEATRRVLRLAGAIDEKDAWIGGALWVVQTGDQLDRGDGERAILDLFDRLATEAKAKGGAFVALNGNHEIMNVALDFRYVTEGGFKEFASIPGVSLGDPRLASLPEAARPRGAAFLPGGPYAKKLAQRSTVAVIGDTVFVHGGVLPKHVQYGLARINREVSAWMSGEAPAAPSIVTADDGPVWTRRYSDSPNSGDCAVLQQALAAIGAKRMVVGHTVQRAGISSACEDKVWRIDVGLARLYGGSPEVLEIRGEVVKAIKASAPAPPSSTGR